MVARTSFSDKITCIFYFSGLLDLTMNDDDDRTIIQTNEDRRILEKRILEELADKTMEGYHKRADDFGREVDI